MNANELADILEKGEQGEKYTGKDMKNAATMLRQQQARIKELEKCTTAYAGFDPHENHEWDRGDWTVGQTESQEFIESSDFNHDVRLYLNGDFEDDTQRLNYLQHIADRLNTHPVKEQELLAEIEALKSVVYWLKENRPEVWEDIKGWSNP